MTLQQLENKIREALPHLKDLSKGCIIFDAKGEFDELKDFEIIGSPVMLNDVLLWLSKILEDKWDEINLQIPTSYDKGYFYFKKTFENIATGSPDINLSSPYLSEQSDELIEFLNGL